MRNARLTRLLPCIIPLLVLAMRAGPLHAQPTSRTYVIVHGAWGGAWAWKAVDSLLTARGHTVYRVTLTGLGERVHLASPQVGLATHVDDVVNTLVYEQLRDVILLGHSYGGMVITGVADRVPERIGRLVYLDAYLPESGESVLSLNAPLRAATMAEWTRFGFNVPPWLEPRRDPPWDVPQPARTFSDALVLTNPAARAVPATYVLTLAAGAETDSFSPFAERAQSRGWPVVRMAADHNPQTSAPAALADVLAAIR